MINQFILKNLNKFKALLWVLLLLPLASLIFRATQNDLGANPVEFITRFTGKYALIFLCVTLAVTPVKKIFNLTALIRFRRLLGLFTFMYVLIHFTIWFWLDHNLDTTEMLKDVVKRPFITVGFIAFILLLCLAATSFNKAIKYMGKTWQKLHYCIYPISIMAVVHYYWIKSSKNNLNDVYLYMAIVAILLAYRIFVKLKK